MLIVTVPADLVHAYERDGYRVLDEGHGAEGHPIPRPLLVRMARDVGGERAVDLAHPAKYDEGEAGAFSTLGASVGALVDGKQRQYGDSFGRAGEVLRVLYPAGIASHQFDDALAVVRVVDKLFRIAQRGADGRDLGGESPWRDVAGYGLLGAARDEARK